MTAKPKGTPPRWTTSLLRLFLPEGSVGASVRADLEQEFHEAVDKRGVAAARRWYTWEVMKLCAHFGWNSAAEILRNGEGGGMDRAAQNLKIAARRFRRSPGFSLVAVVTLALGIGANVAIFSVVDAVLLDPLPYADADELVAVWEWNLSRDNRKNVANPGNFAAWRDRSTTFKSMTAVSMTQPATLSGADEPDEVLIQYASPDFFDVLGLDASSGRTFLTDLSALEATEVVLSERYWRSEFGSDPGVLGRTLQLNSQPVVVVGVLPADFVVFGENTDLWASIQIDRGDQTNSGRWLMVIGRLSDGAGVEAARAEMDALSASLREEFPDFNGGWGVNLVPLKEEVVGDVSQALWILLGSVGMLLLIACANVANLFLVRATERQREMAVRTSLGASGRTLAGQLLTESVLIAGAGAGLGVALAHLGTLTLADRMPDAFSLPRVEAAAVDGPVLLFAVVLTAATALMFGLLPALQAARTSPAGTLNAEARGPSRRSGLVRNGLVIAEVAVSVVLLAAAGLFGRSLLTLMAVDTGMETEHVLVGRVNLSGNAYPNAAEKVAFFDEFIGRVASQPGVDAAGGITFLPLDGLGAGTSYWLEDRPTPAPEDRRAADIRNVSGDYFAAMGIELLRGRSFDSRDIADAPQTIVISRAMADMYWPDGDAVGQRVIVNWVDEEPWEVIGVVDDVHSAGLDTEPREVIYMSYAMATFFPWLHVTVRATGNPSELTSTVRGELAAMDPALPLGSVRLMEDLVRRDTARPRMTTMLMLVFAALATVLAAVGLYGVLAYIVSQRVKEIGVRVALGAQPGDVLRMVVRQGAGLAVAGAVLGLGGAVVGGRVMSGLLFQIEPSDPVALGSSAGLLLVVALVACMVPAWRATRVAPVEALKSE